MSLLHISHQVSKSRGHFDLGETPVAIPQDTLLSDSPHPSKQKTDTFNYWHYHLLSLSGDICVHWILACGQSNRGGAFRPKNLLRSGEFIFPFVFAFVSLSFLWSGEFIMPLLRLEILSWTKQVRQIMADHLKLPVVDQSLKEAFSPRFVFQHYDYQRYKTLSTAELEKGTLKKSVEVSASSSSIDFVGNLTHVMWQMLNKIHRFAIDYVLVKSFVRVDPSNY